MYPLRTRVTCGLLGGLLLAGFLVLAGCDPDDPNPSVGDVNLTGTIRNTTNQPVAGVRVAISGGGATTTDDNGGYALLARTGDSELSVTGQGYTPHTETVHLVALDETRDAVIRGPNQVSWEIVSAWDGDAIALVTTKFYRDGGAPPPGEQPELIRLLSGGGSFFNLSEAPDGTFYVCVEAEEFERECRANVELRGGSVILDEFYLVPELQDDQLIVIVGWGAQPDDLDAHLTGPDGAGGRYHIGARNSRSLADASLLYGGYSTQQKGLRAFETIFFSARRDGMYRYSVMNWSDRDADPFTAAASIAGSPTWVRVYDLSGLIKEYHAPQGGIGNTWRVFELNRSGGSLTFSDNNGNGLGYLIAADQNDPIFVTGGGPNTEGASH